MARYTKIRVRTNNQPNGTPGKKFYSNNKYPEVPKSINDTYVYAEQGDRFDQLAQQYYGDSSLWWVISIANNSFNQGSYFITPGVQLRIPSQIGSIIASYNELNDY